MEMGLKYNLSEQFQLGLDAFEKWMSTHSHPITLFIIADLFESENFEKWFESFLAKHNSRITVGCHGLTHKSWSAWPDDNIGFSHALKTATSILKNTLALPSGTGFSACRIYCPMDGRGSCPGRVCSRFISQSLVAGKTKGWKRNS